MENNIIPYEDYLCVQPVAKKQVLVSDSGNLQTFGKVLSTGEEVKHTKVGDYVAFELWDLKDFSINEEKYYFVKECEVICKVILPEAGVVAQV